MCSAPGVFKQSKVVTGGVVNKPAVDAVEPYRGTWHDPVDKKSPTVTYKRFQNWSCGNWGAL